VIDDDQFPGRQGRLLFAYLVAEEGRPVPRDELADALWGETPPATWDKALYRLLAFELERDDAPVAAFSRSTRAATSSRRGSAASSTSRCSASTSLPCACGTLRARA